MMLEALQTDLQQGVERGTEGHGCQIPVEAEPGVCPQEAQAL